MRLQVALVAVIAVIAIIFELNEGNYLMISLTSIALALLIKVLLDQNKELDNTKNRLKAELDLRQQEQIEKEEQRRLAREAEKGVEIIEGEERQFDMVIDINSILKFNSIPWCFSVREDSEILDIIKNDEKRKSRCFVVIGPFNSGKTFLMHLLYGIKLPELGVASRTKSFSALYIDGTYPTFVVDTAGIFSPCSYSDDFEQEISDMEATEHLLGEVSCKIADYVILVVQDLAWPIQKYISRVRKSLGQHKCLIMIHNWRDAQSKKDVDFLIDEQLIKVFHSEEQDEDEGTYFYTRSTRELSEVRHLCLIDNRCPYGFEENKKKIDLLKIWISHLKAVAQETNFVKKFTTEALGVEIDFSEQEKPKLIKVQNHTPKIQSILRSFDVNKVILQFGEKANNDIDSHKPLVEILYKEDKGTLSINKEKFYNDSQFKIREYFILNDKFFICDVQIPDCSYGFIIDSTSELKEKTVDELCDSIGSYVPSMFVLEVREGGKELKLIVKRVRDNCKICDTYPTDSENYGNVEQLFDLKKNEKQSYIFEDAFCENGSLRIIASLCNSRGDKQGGLYPGGLKFFKDGFKPLEIIDTKEKLAVLEEEVKKRQMEVKNEPAEKDPIITDGE